MKYIYIVRHHFLIEKENSTEEEFAENRVVEWAYKGIEAASEAAVNLALDLMGMEVGKLKDLDEVKTLQHLHEILKPEESISYKAVRVPCFTDDEGKRLEEDLIEIHQLVIMD